MINAEGFKLVSLNIFVSNLNMYILRNLIISFSFNPIQIDFSPLLFQRNRNNLFVVFNFYYSIDCIYCGARLTLFLSKIIYI